MLVYMYNDILLYFLKATFQAEDARIFIKINSYENKAADNYCVLGKYKLQLRLCYSNNSGHYRDISALYYT